MAGLGAPAYDVAACGDDPRDFPLWGAMGGAAMVGFGLAIAQPQRTVLVLTGDGEMLMGLGALATIAAEHPPNLRIVVLDNERYGETGQQLTHTARGTDLAAVAHACGFRNARTVREQAGLSALRTDIYSGEGLLFGVVKDLARRSATGVATSRRRLSHASHARGTARDPTGTGSVTGSVNSVTKTDFRLTYASMFNPPEALHASFDAALADVKATRLGATHAMLIDNQDVYAGRTYENRSPINSTWLLGRFQDGTASDADAAIAAARAAFPAWSGTDWRERVRLVRRVADLIESRLYEMGAVTSLNVGKTRMESLADVQEAADLMRASCDWMERANGYVFQQGSEPLAGYTVRNISVLKPHGVWLVISPFNFPASLTCAPAGAALVAGNTVVTKPSAETSWIVRWLAECFRDAGLPAGVFNFVTGKDDQMGRLLVDHPGVDGVTFTGSHAVGMEIHRKFAQRDYPRPVVLEMGGKNATIVSRHAQLDEAAIGIVRAAFGTAGQKCSCTSRVYAEAPVYEALLERVVAHTRKLIVGDPTRRDVYVGPLISGTRISCVHRLLRGVVESRKDADRWRHAERRRTRARLLLRADRGGRRAVQPSLLERRAVRAVAADRPGGQPGRGDADDQRHRVRPDRRLLRHRGRSAVVFRPHPGGHVVRQPIAGRVHRRVARLPVVRRLERQRCVGQGNGRTVLPAVLSPRAVANAGDAGLTWNQSFTSPVRTAARRSRFTSSPRFAAR